MNNILTIIARFEVKKDQIDRVKASLLKMIEPTRQEQGCLQYDLHQDNDHPEIFIFYENWQSRDLWLAHMESEHLKVHRQETAGLIESLVLNEMTKIG